MPITQVFPYYSDPSPVYTAMENQLTRGANLGTSALSRELESQRANQATQLSKGIAELENWQNMQRLAEAKRQFGEELAWNKQKWEEIKKLYKKGAKKKGIMDLIGQIISTGSKFLPFPANVAGSTAGSALSYAGGSSGDDWSNLVSSELGSYMANYA